MGLQVQLRRAFPAHLVGQSSGLHAIHSKELVAFEAWVDPMLASVLEHEVPLLEAFVADGAFLGAHILLLFLAHPAGEPLVAWIFRGPIFFFRITANSQARLAAFAWSILAFPARFAALGAVGAGGGVGLRCRQILEPCCTS